MLNLEFHGEKENCLENFWRKLDVKAKSINFMVKHKISWRNAGEIPPGFLQEILQHIIEKNEKCAIFTSTVFEKSVNPKMKVTTFFFKYTILYGPVGCYNHLDVFTCWIFHRVLLVHMRLISCSRFLTVDSEIFG